MSETNLLCPKCGSDQLTANKKGFSGKKAVAGAVLTGGVGLLAGTIGSNKVKITCLSCGNEFKPGEGAKTKTEIIEKKKQDASATKWIIGIIAVLALFVFLKDKFSSDSTEIKKEEASKSTNNVFQNNLALSLELQQTQTKDLEKLKAKTDSVLTEYFKNNKIENWEGKVTSRINRNRQGEYTDNGNYVSIWLEANHIDEKQNEVIILVDQIEKTNNESDLIKKGTKIYDEVMQVGHDQEVKFSANYINYDTPEISTIGEKIRTTVHIKVKLTDIKIK